MACESADSDVAKLLLPQVTFPLSALVVDQETIADEDVMLEHRLQRPVAPHLAIRFSENSVGLAVHIVRA